MKADRDSRHDNQLTHTPAALPQVKDLDIQLKRRLGRRQSSSGVFEKRKQFLATVAIRIPGPSKEIC